MSELLLTLIHGTFKPNAEWVESEEPDSFRERLREALARELGDHQVVRYDGDYPGWGGRNTWKARLNGAEDLREYLDNTDAEGVDRFVIAHSHGGNLAFRALKSDPPPSVRGLVCMATPFLETTLAWRPSASSYIAPFVVFIIFADLLRSGGSGPWHWVSAAGLAVLMAILAVVLYTWKQLEPEIRKLAADRRKVAADPSAHPNLHRILDRALGRPKVPLLNLRAEGDEAERLLGWSQRVGLRVSRVLGYLDRAVSVVFGVGVLGLLIGGLSTTKFVERLFAELGWTDGWRWLSTSFSDVVNPSLNVLLSGAVVALLILLFLQLAFGFDELRWILCVRTEVHGSPPEAEAKPVKLAARNGFDHSLWDHPEAPVKIAVWICEVLRSPRDGAAAG